jgi:hypothetical protein
MSLEGLQIAALYSYDCLSARKAGNPALSEFVKKNKNKDEVKKILEKLIPYTWYKLIAKENNIGDPFDKSVVEAYWTGNKLLKKIKKEGSFLFPFHNFTVLKPPHNGDLGLSAMDDCKISLGRVDQIRRARLLISYYPLILRNGNMRLADFLRVKEIKKGFLGEVKVGDWITFHYGIGRETLKKKQGLAFYKRSRRAVELFNRSSQ